MHMDVYAHMCKHKVHTHAAIFYMNVISDLVYPVKLCRPLNVLQ